MKILVTYKTTPLNEYVQGQLFISIMENLTEGLFRKGLFEST
jgi:hypothetical protein